MLVQKGGKRLIKMLEFRSEKDATDFNFEQTYLYLIISRSIIAYANKLTLAECLHSISIGKNVIIQLNFDNAASFGRFLVALNDELANALKESIPLFGEKAPNAISIKMTGSDDRNPFLISTTNNVFTSKAGLRNSIFDILNELLKITYPTAELNIYQEDENDVHKFITEGSNVATGWIFLRLEWASG